jgi:O-antigen biosynthesis protein
VTRGCHVVPADATKNWDLAASVGPFLSCRVSTAVVWHWTPRWRVAIRPRLTSVVAPVAVAGTAGVGGLSVAVVAACLLLLVGAVELRVLSRRVDVAVSASVARALEGDR